MQANKGLFQRSQPGPNARLSALLPPSAIQTKPSVLPSQEPLQGCHYPSRTMNDYMPTPYLI